MGPSGSDDLEGRAAALAAELNAAGGDRHPWAVASQWPGFDGRATAYYARNVIVLTEGTERVLLRRERGSPDWVVVKETLRQTKPMPAQGLSDA